MPDKVAEWIARDAEVKIKRLHAGNTLVREQLRRSYEQIELSRKLLKVPVPELGIPTSQKRKS